MYIKPRLANVATLIVCVAFCYLVFIIWSAKVQFPEVDVELRDLLGYVILAVEIGSQAVFDVAQSGELNVAAKGETKQGKDELLTKADLLSNQVMLSVLQRFPGLNIVSEEKTDNLNAFDTEKYLSQQPELFLKIRPVINSFPSKKYGLSNLVVWIDPLDATQEFTEGLVEYVTVMICISFNGEPIFGAIHRPFTGEKVYGLKNFGILNENGVRWHKSALENSTKTLLISRSHAGAIEKMLGGPHPLDYWIEPAGGSGYKSLRLLNGTADLYLHKTEIKKWDTCAGDALLRSVGGSMLNFDGAPLEYASRGDPVFRRGLLAAAQYPFTHFQYFRKILKT